MSKEHHSPSPWRIGELSGFGDDPPYGVILDKDGFEVASIHGGVARQMSREDIRLIVEAPMMLSILKRFIDNQCYGGEFYVDEETVDDLYSLMDRLGVE